MNLLINLKAYGSMEELKTGLTSDFTFYNEERGHNHFDRKSPAMVDSNSSIGNRPFPLL